MKLKEFGEIEKKKPGREEKKIVIGWRDMS